MNLLDLISILHLPLISIDYPKKKSLLMSCFGIVRSLVVLVDFFQRELSDFKIRKQNFFIEIGFRN